MSHHTEWKPTPWWLRMLGKPPFYRSVQAPAMLGGGWDGFEYAESATPVVTLTGKDGDSQK